MPKRKIVETTLIGSHAVTDDSDIARELYNLKRFGEIKNRKVFLSFYEALYLLDKGRITVLDGRKKEMTHDSLLRRANKIKNFLTNYIVYEDLRSKGYIVRTALKFGAEFRVYDKGIKPGEDHAKWVVFPVPESEKYTWMEFSAKNRVAHSTKKSLLIAVVDDELDVSYWEANWVRP